MGGSFWLSQTVYATWLAQRRGKNRPDFEVLILWRGSPGWREVSSFSGSGTESMAPCRSGGRQQLGPYESALRVGDVTLEFRLDRARNEIQIARRTLSLSEANVILVDSIDARLGAPRVAATLKLNLVLPDGVKEISDTLKSHPEIASMLR
jgi:hypothetical protein